MERILKLAAGIILGTILLVLWGPVVGLIAALFCAGIYKICIKAFLTKT